MSRSPQRTGSFTLTALLALAAILTVISSATELAAAPKRVALVIGNSAYQHTSVLANPENDARLIAEKLRATGFEVLQHTNLSHQDMRRAFATYTSKLESYGRDSVGLLFYAGHGLQVNGQNYVVPVDANISKEADVEVEALNASTLMRSITLLGNKLNIIILDACRNNPYRSMFRSASRGLARMDAPIGSLVAFSTAPGMVAADGTGSNSPYTASLARAITTPGLKIEDMFKRVRNDVFKQTKGSQVPWESSSIFSDFYFSQSKAPQPKAPAATQPASRAGQVWATIQSTTSTAVLESFISQFPNDVYAAFAKARLKELQQKTAKLSTSSQPARTEPARQQAPPRDNRLRAVLASGGKPIANNMRWDVYDPKVNADGKRKHITYTNSATPLFKLKDGKYYIVASHGNARASGEITVRSDQLWGRQFVLNASRLILTSSLTNGSPALKSNVRWDVYHAEKDEDDKRKHITYTTSWRAKFVLPVGRYYVVASHGNARATKEITVAAGKVLKVPLIMNAGRLTLTSSLAKDTPPIKSNVRWDVYHAEKDEDDKRKHITYSTSWRAKFVLPVGRYYITAAHGNAGAAQEIAVAAGKLHKVPLVMNAGRLALTSSLAKDAPPLKSNVRFDVYHAEKDEDDKRKHITYSTSWRAKFALPAGRYHVVATHGSGIGAKEIGIESGKSHKQIIELDAGRIKMIGRSKDGAELTKGLRWDVYAAKVNFEGKRKHITYSTSAKPILTINAGTYRVVLSHGGSRTAGDLTVKPGDTKVFEVTSTK